MTPKDPPLQLDRVDLADIHDPVRLACALHRQLGHPAGAVPVTKIAEALDILEVRLAGLDGCEGTLLTDRVRSYGKILVNNRRGRRRARFSIAHELGHFLLERHVLHKDSGFVCRAKDMKERRRDGVGRKQETEANTFAIGLLAPPHLLEDALREDPDIGVAVRLVRDLDLSREATLRRYVELHDEPLAAVWTRDGVIRSFARGECFPYLAVRMHAGLHTKSRAAGILRSGRIGRSQMRQSEAAAWLRDPDVELFEQTRISRDGKHAVTLLWATPGNGDDEDDDLGIDGHPRFR